MSTQPEKQHLVTDRADRFKVSPSDKGTQLYRDIMIWLEARKDRAKENGMKDLTDDSTQQVRGAYKELLSLEKSVNPKVRPTSVKQKNSLRNKPS